MVKPELLVYDVWEVHFEMTYCVVFLKNYVAGMSLFNFG